VVTGARFGSLKICNIRLCHFLW